MTTASVRVGRAGRTRVRARRYRVVMIGLGIALAGAFVVGVAFGTVWISPWDTLRLVGWKLHLIDRPHVSYATQVIVLQLRLPRVLLAIRHAADPFMARSSSLSHQPAWPERLRRPNVDAPDS